ncbi:MAG: TatD family hydrolase, partial [Planctomycetota bacterium]
SFALNITYPKNKNLIEVLKKVPEDRILFETDAPFLPPQQFRGRTNYPYYVIEGYKMASMLLEISISELADKIFENFKTLMSDVVDVI